MSAPSRAKTSHSERPMPREPPVIIAFFPSNNPILQIYDAPLPAISTGGLVFARFDLGRSDRDALFDFPHQFVDDALGGVGNGDARRGQPHRRVFHCIAPSPAVHRTALPR